MPSQLTCTGTTPPAQGSAPGPPPAHGPVLGNWPIIVRVDLTALLKTIKEDLPLALLLQVAYDQLKQVKLDKDTKGDIDITSDTTNEVIVQRFCAELKKLLGIPAADDDSRCTLAAGVLKINTQGAIGVYTQSRLTQAHGHFMGVLNLLIGGTTCACTLGMSSSSTSLSSMQKLCNRMRAPIRGARRSNRWRNLRQSTPHLRIKMPNAHSIAIRFELW